MSKSTNDKIDLWQEWFKDSVVVGCDPYFIKRDEFNAELSKLIKETLQECIGEEEKLPIDDRAWDYVVHRNQLRQEALTKLEDILR